MQRRTGIALAAGVALVAVAALAVALLGLRAMNGGLGSGFGAGAPSTSHGGPVRDYVSLVDHLRAAGAIVMPQVAPTTKFWQNADAYTVLVNGERVDVYQFADVNSAMQAAAQISDGGGARQTGPNSAEMIDWVAPPHFYRADRVIALYIGRSEHALVPLQQVMGVPFAEERGW